MNGIRRGERARCGRTPLVAATAIASAVITALLLPLSGGALTQAAPANMSAPTITGSVVKGVALVGGTGSWEGTPPISFGFQWQRCDNAGSGCGPIAGATGATYTLAGADVGSRLRVQVTASNADGVASALSAATEVVVDQMGPVSTGEPAVTGAAVVGATLSTTTGSWTGAQPITFAYQWVRCGADGGLPDGSNCAQIANAALATYTLTGNEAGFRIRARVTATNATGSTTVASNATNLVRGSAPANTRAPAVSGSMVEGATLTASTGSWTGAAPITFAYQWLRSNAQGTTFASISGATGMQYRLTAADVGRRVRVTVTARNSAGSTTAPSAVSSTVQAAGPAGVITLPSGEKSIPVSSVPADQRLIVDRVVFTPNVVSSRVGSFAVQVRVKETRGYVVRDALVFIRSIPLLTRAEQPRRPTLTDGYVVFQMQPGASFPRDRRGALQFFVKAYRSGDNPLAGVAGYRLVQVRIRLG
jgi:hypothetical protein